MGKSSLLWHLRHGAPVGIDFLDHFETRRAQGARAMATASFTALRNGASA